MIFSGSRDISGLLSFIEPLEFSPLNRESGDEALWPKTAVDGLPSPWVCSTRPSPAAPTTKTWGGSKARISASCLLQSDGEVHMLEDLL